MPQPVAELEEPDPVLGGNDGAALVEVREIGDAGANPRIAIFADMAGRLVALQLAEMPGERDLLRVAEILVAEHQHGVAVHAGLDRGDLVGRERLGTVDTADLTGKGRVELIDRDRHPRLLSQSVVG